MIALAFLALSCMTSPIQDDGADWMTYNRNFRGDRYSPLKGFDQDNVKQLRQIAHFDLGSKTNFQSGPIAIDGTVYLSTVTHTYAAPGTYIVTLIVSAPGQQSTTGTTAVIGGGPSGTSTATSATLPGRATGSLPAARIG